MPLRAWFARSEAQPGAPGLRALTVSHEEWRQVAQDLAAAGGRLLALWASRDEQHASDRFARHFWPSAADSW